MIGLIVLIALSIGLATLLNVRVEKTIPFAVLSIITVVYTAGLSNRMNWAIWIILTITLGLLIYGIIKQKIRRSIISEGLWGFIVVYLISEIQHKYSFPSTWDEKAQWALTVRWSYVTNTLGAIQGSNCYYADYPPASACFHYFFDKVGFGYSDSKLYVSMTMLMFAFLVPVLANPIIRKSRLKSIIVTIAL